MRSVLVVTASTEQRPSTTALTALLDELDRRHDTRLSIWYLRRGTGERRAGARVVDDLRARGPGALAEGIGARRLASIVKGRVLDQWRRSADPDTVILDDGIGLRALQGWRPRRLVARINPDLPTDAHLESPPVTDADLVLLDRSVEHIAPTGPAVEAPALMRDYEHILKPASRSARSCSRAELGIPPDANLVVGWGDDGWLDGPDLFLRGLWMLNHRFGYAAHGLWITTGGSESFENALLAEARRCEIEDRFRISGEDRLPTRLCGDAVFLPARAEHDSIELLTVVASGLDVITFPVHAVADPGIHTVDHLDLESAATAIVDALGRDRAARSDEAMGRLDVRRIVQTMLRMTEHP